MEEQFLTAAELANRWKVQKRIIYQLKGKVPYYKFKGSIRFKLEDVLAYEAKQKIEEGVTNGATS